MCRIFRVEGSLELVVTIEDPLISMNLTPYTSVQLSHCQFPLPQHQDPPHLFFAQWHHHLGHLCGSHLCSLVQQGVLDHVSIDTGFYCKGCKLRKQIQLPYSSSTTCSSRPFDLVHSDVWGPSLLSQRVVTSIMSYLLMITLDILPFIL
jgi:hypothetical protein